MYYIGQWGRSLEENKNESKMNLLRKDFIHSYYTCHGNGIADGNENQAIADDKCKTAIDGKYFSTQS